MNALNELPYDKCLDLLSAGVVGRVGVCVDSIPKIIPVNYAVIDESVVFRTAAYTLLGTHARNKNLAFQIDHFDYEGHKGWSVLATGPGEMVYDERELSAIRGSWDPQPWVGGSRLLYVRLRWQELTGRRIGSYWPREEELPVRRSLGAAVKPEGDE